MCVNKVYIICRSFFLSLVLYIFPFTTLFAIDGTTSSYTIDNVPNPKTTNNTYVSDPNGYLSANTIYQLNTILSQLEKNTSNQVAVVVLNSIGDEVPKTFSTALFNKWGIGVKGKDNGLLVLMIMDQRRVEFETGYGMESVLPDAVCKRIQTTFMVPKFKEEKYDEGLLEGAKAAIDIMQNSENSQYFLKMEAEQKAEDAEGNSIFLILMIVFFYTGVLIAFILFYSKKSTLKKQGKLDSTPIISNQRWLVLYVLIPTISFFYFFNFYGGINLFLDFTIWLYLYIGFILLESLYRLNKNYQTNKSENDFYKNYEKYTQAHKNWGWAAFFFPLPFLFYLFYYLSQRKKVRNHPRNCTHCGSEMLKLDEKADDAHLSKSQIVEEQLASVDYDVWYCGNCSSKQVLSFKKAFSKYSTCPKCKTIAYYLHSDKTIVSATTSSTGSGEQLYCCKFCNHERIVRYTIPMVTESSSSSGGSSSGGSFGGGSSGGGGSGSSW